jgi:hypothetical protein
MGKEHTPDHAKNKAPQPGSMLRTQQVDPPLTLLSLNRRKENPNFYRTKSEVVSSYK